MHAAHCPGRATDGLRSQTAPKVAMSQTAARKLLGCMRTKPRCGLYQSPPRAAQTFHCMPTRRSTPKPPKVADAKGDLAVQVLRVDNNGIHTSNSLRVQELKDLISAVPADAPAKSYPAAIVEEITLRKYTTSMRKEIASRITVRDGLDDKRLLFRMPRQKSKAYPMVQCKPPPQDRLTHTSPTTASSHKCVSEGFSLC